MFGKARGRTACTGRERTRWPVAVQREGVDFATAARRPRKRALAFVVVRPVGDAQVWMLVLPLAL